MNIKKRDLYPDVDPLALLFDEKYLEQTYGGDVDSRLEDPDDPVFCYRCGLVKNDVRVHNIRAYERCTCYSPDRG